MNKKLIALAIASAFAAPGVALAQGSSVTIYGTANVNFQGTERDDATSVGTTGLATLAATPNGVDVSSRTAMDTDSSNIGLRGTEDLGNGLKAIFQCETTAAIDGNTPASGLCSRNSNVGLTSPWGTLFYGNWDTPFKSSTYGTKAGDPFLSTTVAGFQGIMSSPGFNTRSSSFVSGTNTQSFDLRSQNSVAYWTPNFNGLYGKIQYSADEGESPTGTISPDLWSAAINYDNGPLSVTYAYERHDDVFGLTAIQAASTGTESKDTAHRIAAGYQFGNTTISAAYERLDYENEGTVAGVTDFDRDAWQVGLSHRMGAHEFRARYSQADEGDCDNVANTCTTNELGAKMYAVGYAYHFSKRTQVYAFYTEIDNDDAASYTFTIGGSANVATPGAVGGAGVGSDPEAFGLGIRHTF